MLETNTHLDSLFLLPDNELQQALARGDFPTWVDEYVEYIIAGDGNEDGDYFTFGDGDFGSRPLSYLSNPRSVDRGVSRQKFH